MGRAQGLKTADSFTAVIGGKRGIDGGAALVRDTIEASRENLISLLHDKDLSRRRAAARELETRLIGEEGHEISATERQILWAHTISQEDNLTREALISGLCSDMKRIGATTELLPEMQSAIIYLAASPPDKPAPSANKIIDAFQVIMSGQATLRDTIKPGLYSSLFDALGANPSSQSLTDLFAVLHQTERLSNAPKNESNNLHQRLLQFLDARRNRLDEMAPLIEVWLTEVFNKADARDANLLLVLGLENRTVAPNSTLEKIVAKWAEFIDGEKSFAVDAGWRFLEEGSSEEDDGYQVIRQALYNTYAKENDSYLGRKILRARTPTGDLPSYAEDALENLCASAKEYETVEPYKRLDFALALASLPEKYRDKAEVKEAAQSCAKGAALQLGQDMEAYCEMIAEKGTLNSVRKHRNSQMIEAIQEKIPASFVKSLLLGDDPYDKASSAVNGQIAALYAANIQNSEEIIGKILPRNVIQKLTEKYSRNRHARKGKFHRLLKESDWQDIYASTLDRQMLFNNEEWVRIKPLYENLRDGLEAKLIEVLGT